MFAIKRKGFAMILAIFVVVLIALGGTLLLSNTALGSKSISNGYLRSQAELLAESATEYALMRAQGTNTAAGSCLNQLNITVNDANGGKMFDVNVSLAYSFRGFAPTKAVCTTLAESTQKDSMVLIDATVTSDINSTDEKTVQVHKRSWQKL
jgi:hypothetical protein